MAADGRGDVARTLGLAAKFCEFVIALHGGWRHTGPLWDGDCTCGGATTGGCGIDGLRRRCDALVSFPTSGGARRRRSGRRLLRACRNRVRCERKSAKHVRCMLLVGCNPTRPFLIASSQLSKYRLQSTLHAPLSGSIPTGLAAISALQRLDLSGAGLSGPIPTEMGSLAASLTVLVLSSNNLTGTIPTQLGLLTQLTSLALGQNHLTGHIPTELGNIHNLTHISIESNNLTGAVPNEMGRLFYLEYM
ncbi:hypothetical protein BC830DRAFT_401227 [Chytriomyces sp. MP71]|nr:hypothetical protein BC830DRAFT_401227 [Chytriomyces sp. MP71]